MGFSLSFSFLFADNKFKCVQMESMIGAPAPIVRSIEWEMMDKRKFFPLSMLSSFSIRCCLYPLTVVRTRLQLQKNNTHYSGKIFFHSTLILLINLLVLSILGTFNALTKIYKYEGVRGLYRGFWISSVQVFSGKFAVKVLKCSLSSYFVLGFFYISTFEGLRYLTNQQGIDIRMRALIAGACASVVGQTIIVPFDVISQHLMILNPSRKYKVVSSFYQKY